MNRLVLAALGCFYSHGGYSEAQISGATSLVARSSRKSFVFPSNSCVCAPSGHLMIIIRAAVSEQSFLESRHEELSCFRCF